MDQITVGIIIAIGALLGLGLASLLPFKKQSALHGLAASTAGTLVGALIAIGGIYFYESMDAPAGQNPTDAGYTTNSDMNLDDAMGKLIAAEIEKHPATKRFIELFMEADPVAAKAMVDQLTEVGKDSLEHGGLGAEQMAIIQATAAEAFLRYVPKSQDKDVIHFFELNIKHMEDLKDIHPQYCAIYMFPQAYPMERIPMEVASLNSEPLANAMANCLDSALHNPAPTVNEADHVDAFQTLIMRFLDRMSAQYGEEKVIPAFIAFGTPLDLPNHDPELVANLAIEMYREILALPADESGPMLRMMLSAGM